MVKLPKVPELSTCIWSPDEAKTYRYALTHSWRSEDTPSYVPRKWAVFIGLNPSTAFEGALDPTLRRVRGFSQSWGCDGFRMVNLFAFRATLPAVMKVAPDPIGPDNDRHIMDAVNAEGTECVVAMWGAHGRFMDRDRRVMDMLTGRLSCLGLTKDHAPRHCLYLPKTAQRSMFGYSYPTLP